MNKSPPLLKRGGDIRKRGNFVIELTKLNDTAIFVNVDQIETLEATPDTVITFTNGKKIVVKESVESIINKTIEYKRKTFQE